MNAGTDSNTMNGSLDDIARANALRVGREALLKATPTAAAAVGEQQEELGRQQDALGRRQDELGKQQDVLGREQDHLAAEAEIKFRALVRDALGRGLAQRVN